VSGDTTPPEEQPETERTPDADAPNEAVADAGETPGAPEREEEPTAAAEGSAGESDESDESGDDEEQAPAPRAKPAIPGADLEVDIVIDGDDPLSRANEDELSDAADEQLAAGDEDSEHLPIASAAIDLAADARYTATGKRKTAIARVILKPGTGAYTINGKELNEFFPRPTLQRNIRQPLETVGYEDRMDVIARMQGGGVSAQADALRHGISRALIEADPNLRSELKRRGFLTRDARAKERKKAGLKKARKKPQFSKR
jgi:small subunit ribosomal protein S9